VKEPTYYKKNASKVEEEDMVFGGRLPMSQSVNLPSVPLEQRYIMYKVQAGDTLLKLSYKTNLSVRALREANDFTGDIVAGMVSDSSFD